MRVETERFALRKAFTISRYSRTQIEVVTVSVGDGRGEGVPYPRGGESVASVAEQLQGSAGDLLASLPAGAARNALDCALIDAQAKTSGTSAAALLDLPEPEPVTTAYTLSLDTPEAMETAAREEAERPLLKIKLGGGGDLERLRAVRSGAPHARLIVDANEGWTPETYRALVPLLAELGVALIEQPLPEAQESALADLPRPIPICADESCRTRDDLLRLVGLYDAVNIKLDKTGGLREALALKAAARAEGMQIMVGCMLGTSLAMAPAILLAQGAEFVDLDGPLLLAEDREPALRYEGSILHPAPKELWG